MEPGEALPRLDFVVRHYETSTTKESLDKVEQRISDVGIRDDNATEVFHHHYLTGQDSQVVRKGTPVREVRALVDPEEYVVRVSDPALLIQLANDAHATLSAAWERDGFDGDPPVYTPYEVIIGDVSQPERCYRYRLLDANEGEKERTALLIEQNIQFEKSTDVFQPLGIVASDLPTAASGESALSAVVNPDLFDDSQNELMNQPDIHSGLGFGYRTGRAISHQRVPTGTTRYDVNAATVDIDLTATSVWIVSIDSEKVAALHERKQYT